jgi:hypothetical protein
MPVFVREVHMTAHFEFSTKFGKVLGDSLVGLKYYWRLAKGSGRRLPKLPRPAPSSRAPQRPSAPLAS